MRINKLEHATLVLEEAGHRLVIDPGSLTNPVLDLAHVEAVVVTHEHADHWTRQQFARILDRNPSAAILGTRGVAEAAPEYDVRVVESGSAVRVGSFDLKFFGGQHAVIHSSLPVVDNVGVLVDDLLYYPGDSFEVPDVAVDTLAVPAGAPWLKISEAIDFVAAVHPKRAFPTHYGVLSAAGKQAADTRLKAVTEEVGGEYFPLEPGQSLTI